MCARPDFADPVAIVQLNGDLRHAHAELQSAKRAAHRLRIRFTVEEIARHAEPEILTTAHSTAVGLHEFFASIEQHVRQGASPAPDQESGLSEEQVREAIARVADYMREQRAHYRPTGVPLGPQHVAIMQAFFSPTLLASVRTVQLVNRRLGEVDIYGADKPAGYENLLEFTHMASVTFEDVVVFNEAITTRSLFHALVHAVQFEVLGLARYTELFVRAFLATRWRFNVPLEAHAFELESRFAANRTQGFSVHDEVQLWLTKRRY
ncbi:MAG TPA: hypothetical protein VKF79_04240 [Candidatus Acidoferrum sp.]|nr:hypothetical protein [Candidatus Acidoferrum sp.]